jgi:hypothetical protein
MRGKKKIVRLEAARRNVGEAEYEILAVVSGPFGTVRVVFRFDYPDWHG